jgi:hypothetical protein
MTPDKVRFVAPEFRDDTDAEIQPFIELALRMTSPTAWGNVYGDAIAYLAGHLKLVTAQGDPDASGAGPGAGMGATGPVSAVTLGRWNMSFSGQLTGAEAGLDPASDGSLVTTRLGKLYLMLRRTRANGKARLVLPRGCP